MKFVDSPAAAAGTVELAHRLFGAPLLSEPSPSTLLVLEKLWLELLQRGSRQLTVQIQLHQVKSSMQWQMPWGLFGE